MAKTVYVGCSSTSGTGWNPDDLLADAIDSPYLWTNIVHQEIPQLRDTEMINLGRGGNSNFDIFESALWAISQWHSTESPVKYVFCQWATFNRFRFQAGLELYSTELQAIPIEKSLGINDKVIKQKYYNNLIKELNALTHPHWHICQLVKYAKIIDELCDKLGIISVHLNGACLWDENYFEKLTGPDIKPSDYTLYTQNQILNIENRDDEEITALYDKMHQDYQDAGGINHDRWVNLYQSFITTILDRNYDNQHRGKKSNQLYAQWVKDHLARRQTL